LPVPPHDDDEDDDTTLYYEKSISKKLHDLSLATNLTQNKIDIYPHKPITYTKETQTVNDNDDQHANNDSDSDEANQRSVYIFINLTCDALLEISSLTCNFCNFRDK